MQQWGQRRASLAHVSQLLPWGRATMLRGEGQMTMMQRWRVFDGRWLLLHSQGQLPQQRLEQQLAMRTLQLRGALVVNHALQLMRARRPRFADALSLLP